MAEPYLGEVRIASFKIAPKNWAFCNGQLLPINQNQALFALLSTTYGGNGTTTFALPNLQGSVPLHRGPGFNQGTSGGENAHTLLVGEMPAHTHAPSGSTAAATTNDPSSNVFATGNFGLYTTQSPNTSLVPGTVGNAGGSAPHENRQPFLVLSFIIALAGIFPSRN